MVGRLFGCKTGSKHGAGGLLCQTCQTVQDWSGLWCARGLSLKLHSHRTTATMLERSVGSSAGLALALGLALGSYLTSELVPFPYMDEIFHVPSSLNLCSSTYIHDPKITTPPGLYFVSILLIQSISYCARLVHSFLPFIFINVDLCSLSGLRFLNSVFLYLIFKVINSILNITLKKSSKSYTIVIQSLTLVSIPFIFFFSFLYYTDLGSLYFVLLSYYYSLNNHHYISSLFGLISITFRQTNIVWIAFIASKSIFQYLNQHHKLNINDTSQIVKLPHLIFKVLSIDFINFISIIIPYLFVVFCFCIFIYLNNGIALGDKSNHATSIHIPQFFYCILIMFLLYLPTMFNSILSLQYLPKFNRKSVLITLFSLILINLFINKFTIVHPFIISDNRHYIFYIWKRIFGRHYLIPYLFSPIYLISFYILIRHLNNKLDSYSSIIFWISTFLVTSTTPLIEFRYYIIPIIFFGLHIDFSNQSELNIFKNHSYLQNIAKFISLYGSLILFTLINIITLYIFLYKPFYDDTWDTIYNYHLQRFIW